MADVQSTATVDRPRTAEEKQREYEREFLLDFIAKSDQLRSQFVPIWDEVRDNYLVSGNEGYVLPAIGTENYFGLKAVRSSNAGLSFLRDPETHQVIESLAGQGVGLLLGSREYLAATPIGSDDYEKARFMSRLLMAVMEDEGSFRTHYQLLKDAFTFGTSVIQSGWLARSRMQMIQEPTMDASGLFVTGKRVVPRRVRYVSKVHLVPVDIYDFYPDPSGCRIQEDMLFVAKRFRISKHQARELAKQGVYDSAAVERAIEGVGKENRSGTDQERFPNMAKETADKYGMMTGFEGWGEVPWMPPDKATNRVITVLNGIHVRGHINPFIDGHKPFKEVVVNPMQGRFYGLGPAEVIRFLQDSTNALLMTHTDVSNAAVTAPLLVGQSVGGDLDRLRRREPLDVIPVRDPKQVVRFPVDFNVLVAAAAELTRKKMGMREASGATNPLQAIQSPSDRTTATEFSEVVRLASQRVELQVQLAERDDYPWIGRSIHSRLRQFITDEGAIASLAGEQFMVRLDDIDFESDVRFIGSRHVMSRFQKMSALGRAIEIMSANAEFTAMMPELVVRFLRDGNDIEDAEKIVEMFVQRAEAMREQKMQFELAQKGSVPTAGADSMATEANAAAQAGQRMA